MYPTLFVNGGTAISRHPPEGIASSLRRKDVETPASVHLAGVSLLICMTKSDGFIITNFLAIRKQKLKKLPRLFVNARKSCYNNLAYALPNIVKGGVADMCDQLVSLFIAVVANIVSHFVCKWLDGDK